jgi:spermidine/putrescine transport system substrate-binding protein
MTARVDRSSIDLEEALIRYMVVNKVSRRQLLEAVAKVGPVAALTPVLAACAAAASPSPSLAPSSGASAGSSAAPSPSPVPESELLIYNYADYMDDDIITEFGERYGVDVNVDYFESYDVMYNRILIGDTGYDLTFPTDTDVPGLAEQGKILPLDHTLLPNQVNLAAEWVSPAYDPDHTYSMPYMWWTTGFAYDAERIPEAPTSWEALWNPEWNQHIMMLDDQRETFAVALIRLGYDVNTVDDTELDAALSLLKEQRPHVRLYAGDPIGALKSGDIWIGHEWSGDVWQVQEVRPSVQFVLPEEGGVRGSDAAVILQGARHPVAANLFINHLLDPEVSARNTAATGYMGPNEAAKAFIDPAILEDPTINPDKALIDRLQELLDPGEDLVKYSERWLELRSGA